MKARDFDSNFELGESVVPYLDLTKAVRPGLTPKRVNVDFPDWLLKALDREAAKAGVARQALIKLWLAERVKLETGE
jgi:hypothetical protein